MINKILLYQHHYISSTYTILSFYQYYSIAEPTLIHCSTNIILSLYQHHSIPLPTSLYRSFILILQLQTFVSIFNSFVTMQPLLLELIINQSFDTLIIQIGIKAIKRFL